MNMQSDKVDPREQIYGKGCLWRYEAEQIYRWVPVTQTELAEVEHVLHIYALASVCGTTGST